MAAHSEITKLLNLKNVTFSDATAGVSTLAAGAATLEMKDLQDIINACRASGFELVHTAGALKIRPKDSTL
jgi:hypothetical protein